MTISNLLLLILDSLEKSETSLLSWGDVEGSFSEEELTSLIETILVKNEENLPDEILDEFEQEQYIIELLEEKRLIFRLPHTSSYRTRMAETVRLLSNIRQTFSNRWENSPELVGDYRFLKRPRLYPKRNINIDQALDDLQDLSDLSQKIITDIVGDYKLSQFQVDATKRIIESMRFKKSQGTIICAGTGSGKTLAFYLPAILNIVSSFTIGGHWTKVIATYPRNELLKDQISETVSILTTVNLLLEQKNQRPIKVGAYLD